MNRRPLVAAGTAIGISMGGFFDGILFHQLLQTHNMLSHRLPPGTLMNVEINMFWDGLFHALTWLMTAVGLGLLWRAVQQPADRLDTDRTGRPAGRHRGISTPRAPPRAMMVGAAPSKPCRLARPHRSS